ncbi:hypothetical protein [Vibrio scophthalmi]|uniref:Uncharacterized protein n=1 Tax=Vibrio scophthalmi TaxID=45658 RepID=A0A1E3WRL3_9VIBR|nr:hypothetical protein [Vibrio scophthalmi]ODS12406.1 hypothetical protein VSF3289_02710 [Vibrio scophthalmi]
MKVFLTLPDKQDLPYSIVSEVLAHLMYPFGDEVATQMAWRELGCRLVIIDEYDTLEAVLVGLIDAKEQVLFALEYPEYVDVIGDYCLSLAITNDEGGGIYLLTHKSHNLEALKESIANAKHLDI